MRIHKSIHGNQLGLTVGGRLMDTIGFVAGEHGNQIEYPSPSRTVLFEDFLGDVVPDQINVTAGTDSPAGAAISIAENGTLVLTTGDSNASQAADAIQVAWALNWKASIETATSRLVFQARVKMSAVTTVQAFIGFTDQDSALEMPVTLSATTFTTNASDAVGFMFDTTATTDTIRLVGVAADTDATMQDTANAWDTNWHIFRVEVDKNGAAEFFIDGLQVGTKMSGAVTPATALTPVLTARSLTTATRTMTVDYVHCAKTRV